MTLSPSTLRTVEAVVSIELACLLMLIGRLVQRHLDRGSGPTNAGAISPQALRCWVLGTGLVTLGRLAFALEVPIVAIAGSGVLFFGFSLVWVGARSFCGVPYSWKPVVVGVLAATTGAAFGPRAGIVALSAAGIVASLAIAHTFLAHAPLRQRGVSGFIAGLYITHAAFLLGLHFLPGRLESILVADRPDELTRVVATIGAVVFHTAWVFSAIGLMCQALLLRLRDAAHTDGLTGLLNRRALREDANRIFALCRRKGRACAVLLVDLDHFKRINDTLGHAAGDTALRHFAAVARSCAAPGAIVCRWGGEEFCVVMPGASRVRARRQALRLMDEIADSPATYCGVSIRMTVSVGIAWGEKSDLEFSRLVERADEALYRAKQEGRDLAREAA